MGAQPAIAVDLESREPSDDAIRQRSHEIWEREGRPEGRSDEHWKRARAELAELVARTSNAHLDARPDEDVAPIILIQSDVESPSSDGGDIPELWDEIFYDEMEQAANSEDVSFSLAPDEPAAPLALSQEDGIPQPVIVEAGTPVLSEPVDSDETTCLVDEAPYDEVDQLSNGEDAAFEPDEAPDPLAPCQDGPQLAVVEAETPVSSEQVESGATSWVTEEGLYDEVERALEAVTFSPARAVAPRRRRPLPAKHSSVATTMITAGIAFQGMLEAAGEIQFDGCLEGSICCTSLVVGDDAVVHGEVVADEVTVRGRVEGRIHAIRVLLRAGCHVEGEIEYESLVVETGSQTDCSFRPLCAGKFDPDPIS
jgi:cytoskeletal protein CcmA (bactofilin family)